VTNHPEIILTPNYDKLVMVLLRNLLIADFHQRHLIPSQAYEGPLY
jgi:hypothetical protein